jgi:fructokinase
MRLIYGIGESLLDIIFKDGQPQAARPGGSILNSVVSMGRMQLPVSFISEYGNDDVGNLIDSFLSGNGVNSSFVHRFQKGSTALSIAFLNERNDAHYTFYKDYPGKRLDITFPDIEKDDIILFGSFYAIWPEIREKLISFIREADRRGALIVYDPNFRKSHLSELDVLKPFLIENMQIAGIIRGSDEDFRNIFGAENPDEAWEIVRQYCKCLVYTANVDAVYVRTCSFSGKFPVQKITPLSTIGAGDNFNAGMITSVYYNNISRDDLQCLDQAEWSGVMATAVAFSTHVCLSYDNYISTGFAEMTRKKWKM